MIGEYSGGKGACSRNPFVITMQVNFTFYCSAMFPPISPCTCSFQIQISPNVAEYEIPHPHPQAGLQLY